jgi:hypothetical protein
MENKSVSFSEITICFDLQLLLLGSGMAGMVAGVTRAGWRGVIKAGRAPDKSMEVLLEFTLR